MILVSVRLHLSRLIHQHYTERNFNRYTADRDLFFTCLVHFHSNRNKLIPEMGHNNDTFVTIEIDPLRSVAGFHLEQKCLFLINASQTTLSLPSGYFPKLQSQALGYLFARKQNFCSFSLPWIGLENIYSR